jgi:acyl-CoA thioesterase-1
MKMKLNKVDRKKAFGVFLIVLSLVCGCLSGDESQSLAYAKRPVETAKGNDKKSLPNVLIIGDSISIGYTKTLKRILKGKATVVHNPGNARHSGNGIAKLDSWLGNKKWDVIHFNFGLHDLKYVDQDGKNIKSKKSGHIQTSLEQYEKNMEAIVMRLKMTEAKLIFATTTPYPNKPAGPLREAGQAERYNMVALKVMKKHNVAINDLYTFVQPKLETLQKPKNVHFTDEGSKVLGREVARHILYAIGQQENSPEKK